ncbi:DUF4876 domain-containing protein [Xylanibacter brevis]|uniref:DUF4876 domain-containing protein n=1 Tax=Xylanibacter brevis TaxID=83231 RepID=UPI000693EE96|nr:DUF4876 domain-containing protein [Xylanibacter brevis]
MKLLTQIKMLALMAGAMMTTDAGAVITPNKVSSGDLLISKVFYAASKKAAGSGNYVAGQYVELYNNRDEAVEVQGLYLALLESESAASAYTQAAIEENADLKAALGGKIVVKQIFQIPDDQTYTIEAGKSMIICNSATDHTAGAVTGHDLSGADFEVKTTNTNYPHNDAVPAMKLIYTMTPTLDFMNLSYTGTGSASVMLLKNNAAAVVTAEESLVYGRGKTTGNKFALVNPYYAIDAVEILGNVKNKGVDATMKRLGDTYDQGYASTTAEGGYNGETVYRKTAFVTPAGRRVLYDTNNSTVDFQSSTTIQPRAYDEELAGVTEQEVTIPESGFLVFCPEKSCFGESAISFNYITTNAKNTNLTYNIYGGTDELLAKSVFILTGQPGTYKVYYSEAQPSKKIPSNALTWSEVDALEFSGGQKSRVIYKWVCTPEKVGFERVAKTTEGLYNKATFSGDDRLYLYLTTAMVDAFSAENGAASAEEFTFIKWCGPMPEPTAVQTVKTAANSQSATFYTLDGQQVRMLMPGKIYISRQADGTATKFYSK